jgi:hypothetical protein
MLNYETEKKKNIKGDKNQLLLILETCDHDCWTKT